MSRDIRRVATAEVTLLQNDVMHWFTVTSVNRSGNVSEMASDVAATPTASRSTGRIRS